MDFVGRGIGGGRGKLELRRRVNENKFLENGKIYNRGESD